MNRPSVRRLAIVGGLLLAFALAILSSGPLSAQQRPPSRRVDRPSTVAAAPSGAPATEGATVTSVEVRYAGPITVSRERIISNMRTQVGQPFSQAGVEEDVRNLFQTGDVSNVRIFGEQAGKGVKVIVIVQGRLAIKEIVLEGNSLFSNRRIARTIKSKEGEILNEEILESDRQKIFELYQGRGFNDADIQFRVSRDDRAGNAVVYFTINEGGKSVLQAIRFEGNEHAPARRLRKEMKETKPKTIFSFITKDGRLEQAKLRADLDAVREYYQNRGYIDVEIVQTRTEPFPGNKGITLVVVIREGPQYRLTGLTFTGNRALTDADLRRFLKMQENFLYTPKGLKDDLKVVNDFYGARGYVDARINPVATPAGPGRVNLRYEIEEGQISYVERINIEGNSITKDKVIRRELALRPGDLYNTVYADASKKRLEGLNYFSKVDISPSDTLVPGRKDMSIVLEEKRTGELSFGLGFSSVDKLIGQATLTQGNFDIGNYPSFTGGGQKFRLTASYGTTQKNFTANFTEPYFLDSRFAVGVEGFYRDTNYSTNDYNQRNVGAALTVRRPIIPFVFARLEYRIEDVKISDIQNSSILQLETGARVRSAVTGGLTYDTRDNLFLTRRGTRIDLSGYVAGGILGGSTNIFGFNLDASRYFSLPYDMILLVNGQAAAVAPIAGGGEIYNYFPYDPAFAPIDPSNGRTTQGRRVPIYDRLFLGGGTSLRGFDYRAVGPRDEFNQPIGGRSLLRVTTELTIPIIERVRAAVFYDGGVLNRLPFDFSFRRYASDVGVGVRLDLPVGPIRLDYGFPITRDDPRTSKSGKFNFNVGYQF